MLGLKDIFEIMDTQSIELKTETIALEDAMGRILPEAIVSTMDSPPFDKAAMDGWAVSKGDDQGPWTLIETVAAGDVSQNKVKKGQCAAIMTGAKIPEGCAKIIRVEYTEKKDNQISLVQNEPLENIIYQGENLKCGDTVLPPRCLRAGDIGILASLGLAEIDVASQIKVGIIATGSELKEPGQKLNDGEIYNSNGPQLVAQARAASCITKYYGIAVDDEQIIRETITKALKENDILLLSGGVSMGEFDFVPSTLEALSVKKTFHKAAIKPGRPLWFGRNESCFVFGLPGNPVSTYILFEVFVKHLIYRMSSLPYKPDYLRGILGKGIKRKTWDRTEFLPVRFADEKVYPVSYHGSSHLNAMAEADGLIVVDQGIQEVKEGETVHVRLL